MERVGWWGADLLVGDIHQQAQQLVHSLAPLLKYVDKRVLGACRIIITILEAKHVAGTLAPIGCAVIDSACG